MQERGWMHGGGTSRDAISLQKFIKKNWSGRSSYFGHRFLRQTLDWIRVDTERWPGIRVQYTWTLVRADHRPSIRVKCMVKVHAQRMAASDIQRSRYWSARALGKSLLSIVGGNYFYFWCNEECAYMPLIDARGARTLWAPRILPRRTAPLIIGRPERWGPWIYHRRRWKKQGRNQCEDKLTARTNRRANESGKRTNPIYRAES